MYQYLNIYPGIDFDCDAVLVVSGKDGSKASKVKIISLVVMDVKDFIKYHLYRKEDNSNIIVSQTGYRFTVDSTGEECYLYSNFKDFVHRDPIRYDSYSTIKNYDWKRIYDMSEYIDDMKSKLKMSIEKSNARGYCELLTFRYLIDVKSFMLDKVPVSTYIKIDKDGIKYGTDIVTDSTGIALLNLEPEGYGEVLFSTEDDAMNKLESLFC